VIESRRCSKCRLEGNANLVHVVDGVEICIFCEDGTTPAERSRPHPSMGAASQPKKMAEDTMPNTTSGEGMCGCGRPLPHKGRCAARRAGNDSAPIPKTRRSPTSTKNLHPNGSGIHVSLTASGLNNAIAALLPTLTLEQRAGILE
jgi:hypothetical protein